MLKLHAEKPFLQLLFDAEIEGDWKTGSRPLQERLPWLAATTSSMLLVVEARASSAQTDAVPYNNVWCLCRPPKDFAASVSWPCAFVREWDA